MAKTGRWDWREDAGPVFLCVRFVAIGLNAATGIGWQRVPGAGILTEVLASPAGASSEPV